MEKQVLPSILSADFYELGRELERVEEAGITHLHLDVMDGHYVPNITFGAPLIKSLREKSQLFFDCHLMVEEPSFLFEDFRKAGVDMLTIHVEGCRHINSHLQAIKRMGMKAGVALNPTTPLSGLEYILPDVDLVLLMSVNPGFGGQKFIPQMKDKIRDCKQMIIESGREIILEVDGSLNSENLYEVLELGCDWAVAGSAVFKRGETYQHAKAMNDIARSFPAKS